jgi:phosphonate transport system ATP-binding protein
MMKPSIKTRHLTKIYLNGTCAVNNVSFSVSSDEMTIILGPSGAGKSTLLRCLNRLVEPTSGQIELNGKDITHFNGGFGLQEVRKRVGMIFQQFNLVRRLTVLENVLAGRLSHCRNIFWRLASLSRMFSKPEKDFAFECLKKVRIEDLAFQRADTLSGGQQQRVAIARALAQEPYVFLADEPVASLDPASSEIVMDTLLEIHETQKIPVIVNLHQIELAERYATRLIGMSEGRLVFDGNGSDLSSDIVEKIYGMQVKRTLNYRGSQQKIPLSDTRLDEIEKKGKTVALFKNEKNEQPTEKAVSGGLI